MHPFVTGAGCGSAVGVRTITSRFEAERTLCVQLTLISVSFA